MKRTCRPLPALAILLATAASSAAARAQSVSWQIPEEHLRLDFGGQRPSPTPVFLDDGFALEIPVEFILLKWSRITIEARLSEPGRFQFSLESPQSLVQPGTVETSPGAAQVVLTSLAPPMNRQDLRRRTLQRTEQLLSEELKGARTEGAGLDRAGLRRYLRDQGVTPTNTDEELREQFVRQKAVELGSDKILAALQQLAEKRTQWVSPEAPDEWQSARPRDRMTAYFRLLEMELAEEYLRNLGLEFETNRRNLETVLFSKLEGVYALISGATVNGDEASRQAVRQLSPADAQQLRSRLTVRAKLRLYPDVDAGDANGQWFHGQHAACLVRGASLVRLEGALDAARQDRIDWWTLHGFDPSRFAVRLQSQGKCHHDLFPDRGQLTRLRVRADEGGAVYQIEIVPLEDAGEDDPVIIHESPFLGSAKFPF